MVVIMDIAARAISFSFRQGLRMNTACCVHGKFSVRSNW